MPRKSFGLGGHFKNSNQRWAMIVALAMMTMHEGKFGNKCLDCHNQNSFKPVKHPSWTTLITILPVLPYWVNTSKWIVALVTSKTLTTAMAMISAWTVTKIITKGILIQKQLYPDQPLATKKRALCLRPLPWSSTKKAPLPWKGAHQATPCNACHMKENK